jgi:hypothetical protein
MLFIAEGCIVRAAGLSGCSGGNSRSCAGYRCSGSGRALCACCSVGPDCVNPDAGISGRQHTLFPRRHTLASRTPWISHHRHLGASGVSQDGISTLCDIGELTNDDCVGAVLSWMRLLPAITPVISSFATRSFVSVGCCCQKGSF